MHRGRGKGEDASGGWGAGGCRVEKALTGTKRIGKGLGTPISHPPTRLMVCTVSDAGIYKDRARERVYVAEGGGRNARDGERRSERYTAAGQAIHDLGGRRCLREDRNASSTATARAFEPRLPPATHVLSVGVIYRSAGAG